MTDRRAEFKQLYIEYLNEIVTYEQDRHGRLTTDIQRSRVRHPKQYENINETPLNETVDLLAIPEDSKILIWSDPHFGHKNVIKYSPRPYADVTEMNEMLIHNYNSVVGVNDYVIWCGDVAFLNDTLANNILRRLNGYKILIVGNHDMYKKKVKKLEFDEIYLLYDIEIGGVTIVFTHFPINNLPKPAISVHGHIHNNDDVSPQHINVSVERTDYTPVLFDKIVTEAQKRVLQITTGKNKND